MDDAQASHRFSHPSQSFALAGRAEGAGRGSRGQLKKVWIPFPYAAAPLRPGMTARRIDHGC
jgi:hypothetical protein